MTDTHIPFDRMSRTDRYEIAMNINTRIGFTNDI